MHGAVNGIDMDVEANGTDAGENGGASAKVKAQRDQCVVWFQSWNQTQQTEFAEQLIACMSFHQHEHLYAILLPMLQRDFITALPGMGGMERGGGEVGCWMLMCVRVLMCVRETRWIIGDVVMFVVRCVEV